jgi:hypothetical protein
MVGYPFAKQTSPIRRCCTVRHPHDEVDLHVGGFKYPIKKHHRILYYILKTQKERKGQAVYLVKILTQAPRLDKISENERAQKQQQLFKADCEAFASRIKEEDHMCCLSSKHKTQNLG